MCSQSSSISRGTQQATVRFGQKVGRLGMGSRRLRLVCVYYRSDSVAEGSEYAETGFIISEE